MPNNKPVKSDKRPKRAEPVTLAPLDEIEAIKGLLATPPPPEGWTPKKKKSKKSGKTEE